MQIWQLFYILVKKLNLKYVVITTVTRDDLDDGGAEHFVNVINEIRDTDKDIKVEVLISDLNGDKEAILKIIKPAIIPPIAGINAI